MKVAIDLRAMQVGHQYRGIGSYLNNVLSRFPFDESGHQYVFLRYDSTNPIKDMNLPIKEYDEIILSKPQKPSSRFGKILKRATQEQSHAFKRLKQHNVDVFFQPDQQLGLPKNRKIKKVVVAYDLIPLVLRDLYLPSWKKLATQPGLGKRNRLKVMITAFLHERHYMNGLKTLRHADKILSISQATTKDLGNLLGIPKQKVVTTPLAASLRVKKDQEKRPGSIKNISNDFLLFIGGVDERRRLADLIHAFNLLNGRGYKFDLVLGGKELAVIKKVPNVEARNAILNSSYRDQVHLVGFISEKEKAWLLKNSFAFVYPSLYEGFGLPVLEAMQQGCPVISYKNSSLTEISGNAAILLEEQGSSHIRDAVIALRDSPSLRSKLVKNGKEQAKKFSWEKCAKKTLDTLHKD
jgi:glycosyltransferase involved in cell wall biosynthesis